MPDPTTFRVLPCADRTGWMLCDAYFANGKPMPLDGRGAAAPRSSRASARRGLRTTTPASRSSSTSRARRRSGDRARRDRAARPPAPRRVERVRARLPVPLGQRAWTASPTRSRRSATGSWDVGLPPRSIEDEWGPGQIEFTFSPMEGLAAADAMILFRSAVKADLRAPRPARDVHVLAGAAELLPVRLAPAPVARRYREPAQNAFVHDDASSCRRSAAQFVAGLLDHAREMTRVRRPDRQRLRALPPVLVRARPDLLGGRQPRRADPRPGRPGRRQHARREPPRASRPRTRTSGWPPTSRRASTASSAAPSRRRPSTATRTRRGRRCCRSRSARRSTSSTRSDVLPRRRSATRSSTTW